MDMTTRAHSMTVEWQHRGQLHIHMPMWILMTKGTEEEEEEEEEEEDGGHE